MSRSVVENFLSPGIQQIRHSIRDIDDSYNNDWDIIAELSQNAVDAIRASDRTDGEITIEMNALEKSIKVTDNGIGISPERLPNLLKPFSSDKFNNPNLIGEKGVGLTFALFSCNDFFIKSGNSDGTSVALVKDAFNWKNNTENKSLDLTHERKEEHFQGTQVYLKDINSCPLFKLNFEQLKFLLRTRTSIGNTKSLWENDINIKINLLYIDQNGATHIDNLPFKYYLPYEGIDKNNIIDLEAFIEYAEAADRTDVDKRKKLKDKIIFYKHEFIHSDNRKIKFVSCFVPKRSVWDQLSKGSKLITEEKIADQDYKDNFYYALHTNGIFTSVRGMPTGISVDHPNTGYAGYWSNIFILFEDNHLKFDIGRKSIHGSQSKILKKYSHTIFQEYLKYITKYVSGEVKQETEWDKEEIFAEIESLLELNNENTRFVKTPRDQEASVAAIFFELLGSGKIKDITPLTAGYRNKYDLYAKWGNKKKVIEFKASLRNVLKDFNDEQKMFSEIDAVVCWDVSELDEQAFDKKGIDLSKIVSSLFGVVETKFPHATHVLTLSGMATPIYVLDLKLIIDQQ